MTLACHVEFGVNLQIFLSGEKQTQNKKMIRGEATALTVVLPGETAPRLPKLLIRECRIQCSIATGLWWSGCVKDADFICAVRGAQDYRG